MLGKRSGRPRLGQAAEAGLRDQRRRAQRAFTRFKEIADRKVQFNDADLEALVAEEIGGQIEQAFELLSLDCHGGSTNTPTATVVIEHDGERVETSAEGDGMVDAACKAIKEAAGIDGRLTDYTVTSVTGGVDTLADVALRFEAEGLSIAGRGLSTDVVEASARAFVNAIDRVVRVGGFGRGPLGHGPPRSPPPGHPLTRPSLTTRSWQDADHPQIKILPTSAWGRELDRD